MKNKIIDRKTGNISIIDEDRINIFLYNTFLGRLILKIIICPFVSKLYGKYLNSRLSIRKIKAFVLKNNINLADYEDEKYSCFNDFFIRKIKKNKRKIELDKNILISPCDAKVSVYKISDNHKFKIKNSVYSLDDLISSSNLLSNYKNGYAIVFRLCVDDYHRYCYIDDGYQEDNNFIPGILHTVRPIALSKYKVFSQNQREWTILHTKNFGDVIQIEVGALMVGKIVNLKKNCDFTKGEEKGYFKFGGSTIILIVNDVLIDDDLIRNTKNGYETVVKIGERIGNS